MAEFDRAAERLARGNRGTARRAKPTLSAAARQEALRRQAEQQERALERVRQARKQQYLQQYWKSCEEHFGTQELSRTGNPLQLTATSIHGDGDKIALPPSVLEFLSSQNNGDHTSSSSPWTFRIGIRNPAYQFPVAKSLQELADKGTDEDEDDDEDDDEEQRFQPYVAELEHYYLSYTHGTVVEFTQDEGCVGLPAPIAAALLHPTTIPRKRTVDPSASSGNTEDDAVPMETSTTPGHLAWGAFDVPDSPIEITLIQHLPKGRSTRLRPSPEAVRNGFYRLQDIKLVLEQSLIRTRATLSLQDTILTWHRGQEFALQVVHVEPTAYTGVSCINTDIEVEFEAQQEQTKDTRMEDASPQPTGGRRLNDSASPPPPSLTPLPQPTVPKAALPAEPPSDSPNCITIQLRMPDGTRRQHRFDVTTATIGHVWALAAADTADTIFRLVTRYPRRVWSIDDQQQTLQAAGLQPGQELILVERV